MMIMAVTVTLTGAVVVEMMAAVVASVAEAVIASIAAGMVAEATEVAILLLTEDNVDISCYATASMPWLFLYIYVSESKGKCSNEYGREEWSGGTTLDIG